MNTQRNYVDKITAEIGGLEAIVLSEEQVSQISIFGALNSNQLKTLLSQTTLKECKAGDCIFKQGDLPSDIYVVLSGRVDLVEDRDNIHQIQQTLHSGDSFGVTAVIGIQPQIYTAKVTADSSLLVISTQQLMDIQKTESDLFAMLMMNIARDVSRKFHNQF